MDLLNFVLPVLLYIVCIILVIVLIVLGIKLIFTLDKVNKVVDDVSDKVNSLNGIFSFIDRTTNSFALITETVINSVTSFIFKIFKGRKKKKGNLEEADIDE